MRSWLTGICACFCVATVSAQNLPPVEFYLNTAYMCGGIGSDQAAAFKAARSHYPLSLNFGQKLGNKVAFIADIQVVIRDQYDQTVVNINSEGPFCLLDMDYGKYQVYVTYEGQTLHQTIEVKGTGHQLSFIWPEQNTTELSK